MAVSYRQRVDELLAEAAREHRELLARLPEEVAASLPVDAQGVTQAIDQLAAAAGLSGQARRELISPHAVNPAVLHARVFGGAPLTRSTVIGAFVEGARVRADALLQIADTVDQDRLGGEVRALLIDHPLPLENAGTDAAVAALKQAYAAQEQAALLIAARLDTPPGLDTTPKK
ncbi:MAG TPA: hypothetical protein VME01_01970 [Solirubrobacteraceae bacterium]|nr:hypothetical protein [Solirubrobacteraceae bacterium]